MQVLGDRSIKYRYLNPNTLVVVTGTKPGEWVDPDAQVGVGGGVGVGVGE